MPFRYTKLIISIVFFFYIGLLKFFNKNVKYNRNILLYHNVTKNQRKQFARQMDMVLKYTCPIPADSVIHKKTNSGFVAITFDDGFQNLLQNVIPEINKRNIPITIFIPSGHLGSKPGWYKEDILLKSNKFIMTSDELKEISQNNLITIGSHALSHRKLPLLKLDEAHKEIFSSKEQLEKIVDKEINLISFPYGEYNSEIISLCRQAGYDYTYSVLPVPVEFNEKEYIKGRINAEPSDGFLEFRLKLAGAYFWLPKAFAIKKFVKNVFFND